MQLTSIPFLSMIVACGPASDVWQSTRANKSAPFGALVARFELDSNITVPGWISDDECRLYLAKEDTDNNLDLFVASKPAN